MEREPIGERGGRLYAIYHQGRYSGGHPSTYFDACHEREAEFTAARAEYPDIRYSSRFG